MQPQGLGLCSLALSADGRRIAWGATDGSALVFDSTNAYGALAADNNTNRWGDTTPVVLNGATLELLGRVPFNREGWGMCAADGFVVTSDGSSELVRRDPQTLEPQAVLYVRCAGQRVPGLNDLAWSAGTIWANVAGTHYLAGIDPDSGEVTDVVNARKAWERHIGDPQAIMNGIAALPAEGEFLLTGKSWRSIRHVRLSLTRDKTAPDRVLGGRTR